MQIKDTTKEKLHCSIDKNTISQIAVKPTDRVRSNPQIFIESIVLVIIVCFLFLFFL